MSEDEKTDPAKPTNGKKSDAEEQREHNRSAVRMIVTYVATGFIFVVGAAIVGYFIATDKHDDGKDIFLAILPIASAVITYWFAARQSGSTARSVNG